MKSVSRSCQKTRRTIRRTKTRTFRSEMMRTFSTVKAKTKNVVTETLVTNKTTGEETTENTKVKCVFYKFQFL